MDEKSVRAMCSLMELMTLQHREEMNLLRAIMDKSEACFQMCEEHADNLVDVAETLGSYPGQVASV